MLGICEVSTESPMKSAYVKLKKVNECRVWEKLQQTKAVLFGYLAMEFLAAALGL